MSEETHSPATVTFIGHSTLLFEIKGLRLITDPVLRSRVTFLRRYAPPVDPEAYQDIDAVLISHLHYDHLDFASLSLLGKDVHLIVPAGAGQLVARYGFMNFQEVRAGETAIIKGITVRVTPADHHRSRRPGPGSSNADCLGYLIQGSTSIYFPGDTRVFPGMAELAGAIDLALMPVWGWGFKRGKMHMGPLEAAQSLNLLQPRLAIPIHWGTYAPPTTKWLKPAYLSFPPIEFITWARQYAPQVETKILIPGESIKI